VALDREEWSAAETLERESLCLAEAVHRQELIASDCHRVAQALARQGKPTEARTHAYRAVEIYTRLGSPDLRFALAIQPECEG